MSCCKNAINDALSFWIKAIALCMMCGGRLERLMGDWEESDVGDVVGLVNDPDDDLFPLLELLVLVVDIGRVWTELICCSS